MGRHRQGPLHLRKVLDVSAVSRRPAGSHGAGEVRPGLGPHPCVGLGDDECQGGRRDGGPARHVEVVGDVSAVDDAARIRASAEPPRLPAAGAPEVPEPCESRRGGLGPPVGLRFGPGGGRGGHAPGEVPGRRARLARGPDPRGLSGLLGDDGPMEPRVPATVEPRPRRWTLGGGPAPEARPFASGAGEGPPGVETVAATAGNTERKLVRDAVAPSGRGLQTREGRVSETSDTKVPGRPQGAYRYPQRKETPDVSPERPSVEGPNTL